MHSPRMYHTHTAIVEPQNRKHTCGHAKTCWSRDKPMVGSLSYVIELQRGPVVQYSIDAGGSLPTLVKANHRGVCGANYPAKKKIITAVSACCCGPLYIAGACPPRKNSMQRSWILFKRRHGEGMRLVWLSRKQKGQRNRVVRLLVLCVCCPQKKIRLGPLGIGVLTETNNNAPRRARMQLALSPHVAKELRSWLDL